MKTLIALDIDGTITSDLHSLPEQVIDYFETIVQQGDLLAFITGRSFSLANSILGKLNFPYLLALHNGAIILQMPERRIISKQYMDP